MDFKGILSLAIGVVGLLFCNFAHIHGREEMLKTLNDISIGLIIGGLIEFVAFVYIQWNSLRVIISTLLFRPRKNIRLTMAYLFRIETDGKYLLVKRHRNDQIGYQPVGGTYKYLRDENAELFDELGIEPCHFIQRDNDGKDDLRIILKHRYKLYRFLKWFHSRKKRELDPWREFYEELICDNLVDARTFPFIQYSFVKRKEELVIPSPAYPSIDEYRYADIYELKYTTAQQYEAIKNLSTRTDEAVIIATPAEIRKGITSNGKIILPHSKKILAQ